MEGIQESWIPATDAESDRCRLQEPQQSGPSSTLRPTCQCNGAQAVSLIHVPVEEQRERRTCWSHASAAPGEAEEGRDLVTACLGDRPGVIQQTRHIHLD